MTVRVAVTLLAVCLLGTSLAAPVIHPDVVNLLQELQQLRANKELGKQQMVYQSQLPGWQCETHYSDGESTVICAGTWSNTNPPPNVTQILQQLRANKELRKQEMVYQSQLPGWQCETHYSDGDARVICAGTWSNTNPPPNVTQILQQLRANKELGKQEMVYQSQLPGWQCETHYSDGEATVICAGKWINTNTPSNPEMTPSETPSATPSATPPETFPELPSVSSVTPLESPETPPPETLPPMLRFFPRPIYRYNTGFITQQQHEQH